MSQYFGYLAGSSNNADRFAVAGNTNAFNFYGLDTGQITAVVTDLTPTDKVFTAVAATDICTAAANGFVLGQVVTLTNSGGALPAGLSVLTNYYVIPINGDTFYLADSYAHAIAGTHIDITDAGTGTNTVVSTALADGDLTLQNAQADQNGAVIASTWKDVPNTVIDISALGVFNFPILNTDFPYYRLALTDNDSGVYGITCTYSAKAKGA